MEKNKLFGRQLTDKRKVRERECVKKRGGHKSRWETKEGGGGAPDNWWCLVFAPGEANG